MSNAAASSGADTPAAEIAAHLIEVTQAFSRFRASAHNTAPGEADGLLNHLLFQVLRDGPLRASELAESWHADPSTVSRQVATLVSRGLLERRADAQDGRASLLQATAAGVAYKERLTGSRNAHFSELLADWSEDDQRCFATLLDRFVDDFARYRETWLAAIASPASESQSSSARFESRRATA
jgi:DNA-binding MarR family transcriptional regulator